MSFAFCTDIFLRIWRCANTNSFITTVLNYLQQQQRLYIGIGCFAWITAGKKRISSIYFFFQCHFWQGYKLVTTRFILVTIRNFFTFLFPLLLTERCMCFCTGSYSYPSFILPYLFQIKFVSFSLNIFIFCSALFSS